jgi:hypothetical protein
VETTFAKSHAQAIELARVLFDQVIPPGRNARESAGQPIEITAGLTFQSCRHPSTNWGPAFCQHVLQQKRDASFRWHDGENGKLMSIDRSPV